VLICSNDRVSFVAFAARATDDKQILSRICIRLLVKSSSTTGIDRNIHRIREGSISEYTYDGHYNGHILKAEEYVLDKAFVPYKED
jgi:hypothetical protein